MSIDGVFCALQSYLHWVVVDMSTISFYSNWFGTIHDKYESIEANYRHNEFHIY